MAYDLKGKSILVTGGVGSIGSEIVRKVLGEKPKTVRVFDVNENGLFDLQQRLNGNGEINVRFIVGDVRNRYRLNRAMEGVDVVFHAAALKHVPMCEYNTFEAIETNINGTENVINAALDNDVSRVITISTDKAVNPSSTMGATKLLMERLTIDANNYRGSEGPVFSCVRFGNVAWSRGSVLPIFEKQISRGGPVTITDPNMTRFVMSTEQAIDLLLKAMSMVKGGEIFIFKMPVVRLRDLAGAIIEEFAPKYGRKPSDIKIKEIGIRPGEKVHEELMTDSEIKRAYETKDMFIVPPETGNGQYKYEGVKRTKIRRYSSKDQKPLNEAQMRSLLQKQSKALGVFT
jgi:FlaA1/EpsC-like NDP-sugar epimerase